MQMLQLTKSLRCKQMAQLFYQQASVWVLHGLEHLQPENYNIAHWNVVQAISICSVCNLFNSMHLLTFKCRVFNSFHVYWLVTPECNSNLQNVILFEICNLIARGGETFHALSDDKVSGAYVSAPYFHLECHKRSSYCIHAHWGSECYSNITEQWTTLSYNSLAKKFLWLTSPTKRKLSVHYGPTHYRHARAYEDNKCP